MSACGVTQRLMLAVGVILLYSSGVSSAAEPCFWTQKVGTEQYKSNGRVTGLTTEDVSQRLNHGITSNGTALASGSQGKEIQWKVGKSPRNGTGCFKKPRMLQRDNLLHHPEADDTKMESDLVGSHLVKCSNAGNKLINSWYGHSNLFFSF